MDEKLIRQEEALKRLIYWLSGLEKTDPEAAALNYRALTLRHKDSHLQARAARHFFNVGEYRWAIRSLRTVEAEQEALFERDLLLLIRALLRAGALLQVRERCAEYLQKFPDANPAPKVRALLEELSGDLVLVVKVSAIKGQAIADLHKP